MFQGRLTCNLCVTEGPATPHAGNSVGRPARGVVGEVVSGFISANALTGRRFGSEFPAYPGLELSVNSYSPQFGDVAWL